MGLDSSRVGLEIVLNSALCAEHQYYVAHGLYWCVFRIQFGICCTKHRSDREFVQYFCVFGCNTEVWPASVHLCSKVVWIFVWSCFFVIECSFCFCVLFLVEATLPRGSINVIYRIQCEICCTTHQSYRDFVQYLYVFGCNLEVWFASVFLSKREQIMVWSSLDERPSLYVISWVI